VCVPDAGRPTTYAMMAPDEDVIKNVYILLSDEDSKFVHYSIIVNPY
jgi:hypothetical protein